MTIDLKVTSVEPRRRNFDHIAARIGPDKLASRYQEAVWGLQPDLNFHYRPTWDAERELYDRSRTALVMKDFDDFVDPRQYYYGSWTMQRGRQQDSQEKNFDFVEKRGLLAALPRAVQNSIAALVIPVRHLAWAANTNNCYIAAYGFGAPLTSAASMHMMDHLGIAQYISRIGLLLADNETTVLDAAKHAWLTAVSWQPLRELTETSMVTHDWFELFVLQNFLIDGVIHGLVFEHFDARVVASGGAAFSMLCEFMTEWRTESCRWVDAMLKIAADESASNQDLLNTWLAQWSPRLRESLAPLADMVFANDASEIVDALFAKLRTRAAAAGLTF